MPPEPMPPVPTDEETGSFRRPAPAPEPLNQAEGTITLGGKQIPIWWILLGSAFGLGTGGAAGGSMDLFGVRGLQAEVAALRSDVVELRHQREIDLLRCGCAGQSGG